MDNLRSFRILQLPVKGNYCSDYVSLIGEIDDKMIFESLSRGAESYDILYDGKTLIFSDNTNDQETEFRHLMGDIATVKHIKKLLNNPAYIGCTVKHCVNTCYFKKYGRLYGLIVQDQFVQVFYKDIDDHDRFRYSDNITSYDFDKFVDVILQTTNVKSARN
jgi:hypothetical protein